MKHSRIHIKGFKRSFKICHTSTSIDTSSPDRVVAFLLRHYATFSPSMQMQIYRKNYTVQRLD